MTIRIHTTILFTALILVLALAGRARAGEYTIHNCPASLQSNFDAGPWQSYGGSLPSVGGFQGSCTPGSTLGTAIGWYATAQALNSNLGVILQSPSSGITIREMRLVWSVSHQSSGSDTFAEVVSDTGSELIDPTPYAAGTSNPAKVYFPDGTHTVYVYSYCSYDNSANCNFPSPTSPVIKLEGMDTTLTDADPPTATINGGSLAPSGPVSGNATLQFTATDGQSGVRESQLLIDGSPVVTDNYSSQCPYTNFAACPQSQVNSMTWNTNTVANGEHRVALRITDPAGNTHTVDDHSVTVSNPSATGPPAGSEPPACAEAPGTHTKVTVAAKHRLLISGYRQRAHLNGRLLGAGKPISGATVEILTRPAVTGGKFSLLGHVTTRAHGQFKLTIPPGISRTVCLRYRALPGGVYTAALAVTQQVKAGVTLAVHPRAVESNGTIILTGNVLGGYISGAGKVVELQVFYLGSWRVFQTVRTQPNGRFTSFYNFLGGQGTFAFRASVRSENDYPYALGYSHPVKVRAG
jgi:hypothetical protein